jgi:hypothetical protein
MRRAGPRPLAGFSRPNSALLVNVDELGFRARDRAANRAIVRDGNSAAERGLLGS